MENTVLKGALLAEMIENSLLKTCFETDEKPEDFEERTDYLIERAVTNTEIELCEGERIELQRQVFMLIQMFICKKPTGEIKQEIQAIYIKYHASKNEIESILGKAKDGVEKTANVIEKGKEIYNEAKPVISTIMAILNLAKIFFKK